MKSRSDDLFFLLSVVDGGSFTAAAEQLEVSVTRVSRAVTRLERSLAEVMRYVNAAEKWA